MYLGFVSAEIWVEYFLDFVPYAFNHSSNLNTYAFNAMAISDTRTSEKFHVHDTNISILVKISRQLFSWQYWLVSNISWAIAIRISTMDFPRC